MAIHAPLEQAAKKLLSPHSELFPFLFDQSGKMLEDKRRSILRIVNFVVRKTLGSVDGLYVEDVCLVGSSVSYFYHKDSDLDVIAIIKNKSCPYLFQEPKKLFYFTDKLHMEMLPREAVSLDGKPMDIILRTVGFDEHDKDKFSNAYSVLNNQWVRHYKPDTIIPKNLTVASLIKLYYRELTEINRFLKGIKIENGVYTRSQAMEIIDFYNAIIGKLKNSSRTTTILYKLLRSQNKIQNLGQLAALALRNSLGQERGNEHEHEQFNEY